MTLHKFQKFSKAGSLLLMILLYTVVTFSIGRITTDRLENVKGVSASSAREVIENPIPSADFQSPNIIPSSIKLCSNSHYGFEVGYDLDWFTTYNTIEEKCTFFAPYSFVAPYYIQEVFVPVNLEILDADDWLSTLLYYENPNDFYNVTSATNIEINGRLVKKIEAISTGEGSLPRGYEAMHLLVFDGEKPIRISYTQLDEDEDITASKAAALNMLENLKYF